MGVYYEVVNPAKRQYLDIFDFGESLTWGGLITGSRGSSLHAMAIAWLACRPQSANSVLSGDEVGGAWFGDPIYLASDAAPADLNGIRTSTPEHPEQNLYAMAWREFEDVTPRVIRALCEKDEEIARILVERADLSREAESPCRLLRVLGRLAVEDGCHEVERALDGRYGEVWRDEYAKAEQYWSRFDRDR